MIVLETLAESIDAIAEAVSKIPGLEWLADIDLGDADPTDGFADEEDPEKRIPHRLYAVFTNQQAMNSLLSLWQAWLAEPNKRAARGFGPFKRLFINLSDIRRWGAADRISETGILEFWREDIEVKGGQGTSVFEIELWFRNDATRRSSLAGEVRAQVEAVEGRELSSCAIEDIRYHALLIEVPSAYIEALLSQLAQQKYTQLLMAEGVMFFRPQAQSRFRLVQPEVTTFDLTQKLTGAAAPQGDPVAAILDGVPLANHAALQGRVILDDPDDHASHYQPGQHLHGTAMSSIVLFGDLNGSANAQPRPVYVRPILQPDSFGREEVTPPNRLLVDVIHRAVRRMMEGEEGNAPVAPSVRIVSLSIGDRSRPFDRDVSPLARIIDWLAWKYRLLFIISAGNCTSDIVVDSTFDEWQQLSVEDRAIAILRAMRSDQFRRRPLSPAEAINAVTVGASHRDECTIFTAGQRVDLLDGTGGPSPLTTVASGFRRSTKPDILLPGGRQFYYRPAGNGDVPTVFRVAPVASAPGQLAAAPGVGPMEVTRVAYCCGTSNSAALATRYLALALERLNQAPQVLAAEIPVDPFWAVILKSLIVHGASWEEASQLIEKAFALQNADWREAVGTKRQFLGFGEVSPDRCLSASDQRATVIGWGEIRDQEGLVFFLPLPPALSAVKEYRRLTTTLTWLTSPNQRHKNYRRAQLYLSVPVEQLGAKTIGVDAKTAQRGTVEHRVFAGTDAKAFLDGTNLSIQVNCKADAGKLDEPTPFALVVSLEVEATSTIAVYNEVESRIRAQVEITTG
ncbi:MAG: S8 family peptidase [Bryobacterales bacterium]|nr:S8 family peptidase [Bryobacterales bacterium]